nr:hypothetical protein [Tanacetum cinerariifolium]
MNPVVAQQVILDNALVALEKRLKIEKCNARIKFSKLQREETYPKVYMHQFWNTIKKIKDSDAYRFKLDKKKFQIDTEELSYSRKCDMSSATYIDQLHQPWRTFAAIMNREISSTRKENMPYPRLTKDILSHFISKDKTISMRNRINLHIGRDDSLLGRLKFVSKIQDYQIYGALIPGEMINQDIKEKPKRGKKPVKKSTTMPIAGVDIRDTPDVFVSKKKAPTKKSKMETHKLHASSSGNGVDSQTKVPDEQQDKITGTNKGTGTKLGVPDVPKDQYENENESWGNSKDDANNNDDSDDVSNDDDDDDNVDSDVDGDNEASDSEKTYYDEDDNPNLNQYEDKEEEYKEEYVRTPENYKFTDDEINSLMKKKNMRNYNPSPADTEIISMMNIDVHHEEPSTQTPPLLTIPVTILLDKMQKSKSYQSAQEHKELHDGLVKSYKLDKELFESYGKAYSLKRDREDKDKDEDSPAGSD